MNKEEKLDRVLEEIAKINSKIEVTLTPEELAVLTEQVTRDEVETKNKQLTKKYRDILISFGCNSYEDLYNITQNNKYKVEKNKDFPNLAKEKREVTRDGKTFETTLYVDPKLGVDNKIKAKKNKLKGNNQQGETAKALQPVNIQQKELKEARKFIKDLVITQGSYEDAIIAKHLVDIYGIVQVSIGFKTTKDSYGEVAYIATSGIYEDVIIRTFFELIRFCLLNKLNCRVNFMQKTQTQKYLGLAYNFKEEGDSIVSSYKDLIETFGSLEI